MNGREFLAAARAVVTGSSEAYWRTAAVNAYYALFLECREAQDRWGFAAPRSNAHHEVRLRFVYATDADLKQLGRVLEKLGELRSRASYKLTSVTEFASSTRAHLAIQQAQDAIDLQDAIEADPARLAAAIASIPP